MPSISCASSRLSLVFIVGVVPACGSPKWFDRKINAALGRNHTTMRAQDPSACSSADVRHIERPLNPDKDAAATFDYAFEYHPGTDADALTVVYVPGGPGQTAIGTARDWEGTFPEGTGLLLTDPRGVGCNYHGEEAEDFYTSRFVAQDILAAVASLNLKNYVLYGISYGTVVASIAGAVADGAAVSPPKAVVLEGTLGRAFASTDEIHGTYKQLWDSTLSTFEATYGKERAELFRGPSFPLHYSQETWQSVIRTALMIGPIAQDGIAINILPEIMRQATSDDDDDKKWARDVVESLAADDSMESKGVDEFYTYISCREIFSDIRSMILKDGVFVEEGDNLCAEANLALTDEAFDAKKWAIKVPTVYFQGTDDPATPAFLAQYHFDAQEQAKQRTLVYVKTAAHNPMGMDLSSCAPKLWETIDQAGDLEKTIDNCAWTPGFKILAAPQGGEVTTTER